MWVLEFGRQKIVRTEIPWLESLGDTGGESKMGREELLMGRGQGKVGNVKPRGFICIMHGVLHAQCVFWDVAALSISPVLFPMD